MKPVGDIQKHQQSHEQHVGILPPHFGPHQEAARKHLPHITLETRGWTHGLRIGLSLPLRHGGRGTFRRSVLSPRSPEIILHIHTRPICTNKSNIFIRTKSLRQHRNRSPAPEPARRIRTADKKRKGAPCPRTIVQQGNAGIRGQPETMYRQPAGQYHRFRRTISPHASDKSRHRHPANFERETFSNALDSSDRTAP